MGTETTVAVCPGSTFLDLRATALRWAEECTPCERVAAKSAVVNTTGATLLQQMQEAYMLANKRMQQAASARKAIFDPKAQELHVPVGTQVYLRNHPAGRNKIQDAFQG